MCAKIMIQNKPLVKLTIVTYWQHEVSAYKIHLMHTEYQ